MIALKCIKYSFVRFFPASQTHTHTYTKEISWIYIWKLACSLFHLSIWCLFDTFGSHYFMARMQTEVTTADWIKQWSFKSIGWRWNNLIWANHFLRSLKIVRGSLIYTHTQLHHRAYWYNWIEFLKSKISKIKSVHSE